MNPLPKARSIGLWSALTSVLLAAPLVLAQEDAPEEPVVVVAEPESVETEPESVEAEPESVEAEPEPVETEPEPVEEEEEDWDDFPEELPPQLGWFANDPVGQARAEMRGERVYRRFCATCHGRRGNGRGESARFLSVRPRDFRPGTYKWRTNPSGSLPGDDDILRTVIRGAPGTSMPSWGGRLPMRDIRAVVQFIKTFSDRFGEEEVAAAIPMPTEAPALDAEATSRGQALYTLMRCWQCHGIRGDGQSDAVTEMTDDAGNPIEPYDFTSGRFRSGGRPIDIFRTFTAGLDGTPMPSYREALMVGRDAFEDLSPFDEVLTEEGRSRLGAYLETNPTTEEIWNMSEVDRQAWADGRRWDLVAYVISLSRGAEAWRYLWGTVWLTE